MSEDFHRLERAYRTTVYANRALLNASSEAQLAPEFCRIAVEQGGYRLAWVGYVENDEAKNIRPVAEVGFDAGYLENAQLTWADSERGQGPTGTAVRTGRPQVAQNIATDPRFAPWRDEAQRHGFGSSVSLPLRDGDTTFGVLGLYAAESDAFDPAEMGLLELLAADLTHAILCSRGKRTLSRMQQTFARGTQLLAAGQAAAKLAHDLNNCFAVVVPCLDELATRAPPDCQPSVADATLALERARALTARLLRPEAQRGERSGTSPDVVLMEMAPALRRALGEDVTLDLLLDASGQRTRIEPLEFDRIVTNLILNAGDAIGGRGSVRISTRPIVLRYPMPAAYAGVAAGSYVAVSVSDSGSGISEEAREHLFEPFFTTKGERGTGLGLASVYALVHQVGGHVSVESEAGKGAVFEVLLPTT